MRNNEMAFPCPMSEQTYSNQDCEPFQGGMTLRDYFAAKALQGYFSNVDRGAFSYEEWAKASYEAADAMLEARK